MKPLNLPVLCIKEMKSRLCLILSLLSITKAYSQYPSIMHAELYPTNPTNIDSIFLVTTVGLNTQGYLLASLVEMNNDTIYVRSCYRESPLYAPIYVFDTTFIGIHNDGSYVVAFTAYSSGALNPNCDYQDSNHLVLGLTVELDEIIVSKKREIVKQIDLSGRESKDVPNTILIRFYNDGGTEKVVIVE
jgi:hypothetical protein